MATHTKTVVVHSPHAGNSHNLSDALTYLRQHQVQIVDLLAITDIADTPPLGEQWREQGVDFVLAAGGDGLLSGVAAHVIDSQLPLAILPLGTANDVARSIGMPLAPEEAINAIVHGETRPLDAGFAYPVDTIQTLRPKPRGKPRFFTQALTLGMNVQFAERATDPDIRQQFGSLTYPVALVDALKNYQPVEVELDFKDLITHTNHSQLNPTNILHCKAAQVLVINTPVFWGALQATIPGVNPTDRILDIVVIEDASINEVVLHTVQFFSQKTQGNPFESDWHKQFPALLSSQLSNIAGIHHLQAKGVLIKTPTGKHGTTLDGEVCEETPVYAHIADKQLAVIYPPNK